MRLLLSCILCAFIIFASLAQRAGSLAATQGRETGPLASNPAGELAGLWEAKRRFGPDVRGTLIIKQSGGAWSAEIAGHQTQAKLAGDAVTFELPDGRGAFQGRLGARRTEIVGHWIQEPMVESGSRYASPVTLTKYGRDVWRGEVMPVESTMTFYLMIKARDDGSTGAFLVNPERNLGWQQYRVDHLEREGDAVKLVAADKENEKGRVLVEGRYYADALERMTFYLPFRGGSFDFRRVAANETSDFYPRGLPTAPYAYAPPHAFNDGWPTASLEDVGISRDAIQKFIQMIIETPMDSVHAPQVHSILIARHGKLVLEEYFHGESREKPHDTRSAAKSVTSTLVGASIKAGVPLEVSSPVYQVMNGGAFPPNLEARKKALTVEHLLTMSSGFDCDDADPNSPGRENYMTDESEEPDYYKFTMALKMIREPGEKAVYCSCQPNLLGGVLQRASGKSLPPLFQELIAEPLQIKHYYMPLTPTGDAYMGGSVRFLARDFMKFGQLLLNGGTWNGHKVLTPEWVRRATSPLYEVKDNKPTAPSTYLKYGYLWWVLDYPYKGRTVQGFYAGGNGGQVVMVIPELDLVIAQFAGNYADGRVSYGTTQSFMAQYILPAVDEKR